MTGSTNLMASARVPDAAALYRYMTTRVAEIEGIGSVEIVPQLARIKQSHSLMHNGRVTAPPS